MNQFTYKYSEQDYIKRCNDIGVRYVGYHREKKRGAVIEYICSNHEEKGIQCTDWSHFKNQKRSCKYCSGRNMTTEEFHFQIRNQDIVFLSEFQGIEKPLKCMCKTCGNIWITNSPKDLRRRNGCPRCGEKAKGLGRKKDEEQFKKDLYDKNSNIKIIGKYSGAHKLVKCECLIDGYIWESYACNLLNGSASCPICNNSVGENEIIKALQEWNVEYKTQKTFDDCKDDGLLRFDVYDIANKIAIEFQGEQHYYPIDFSGEGELVANEAFSRLQKRDQIKQEYCAKNNITLICIPYWERGNVKQYLINNCSVYESYSA